MISLSLKALAGVLEVNAEGLPDGGFSGVTIDSRKSCEAKLFVAIKGDNFDGHNFVDAAWRNGAAVALVEQRQALFLEFRRADGFHGSAAEWTYCLTGLSL